MAKPARKQLNVLFFDIITGDEQLRKSIHARVYRGGTYSESMRRFFGLKKSEWTYVNAAAGKFPENFLAFDAVVMGGSTEDPIEGREKPWVKKTYPFLRAVIKHGTPVFGICGGLQFVVRALGGKVVLNPKGREFGTIGIKLSSAGISDPLFKGLPASITASSSHKCIAEALRPGWKLLASSRQCGIQAIAIGDSVRLVQFHPEMSRRQLRSLAVMRKNALLNERFFKNEKAFRRFVDAVQDTGKTGKKIARNFLKYIVLPKAER